MAVALRRAAPLKPPILLAQALSEYKAILDGDDKAEFKRYCSLSPPTANDVMRFTAEIDRASYNQKRRRCFGPRLTNVLQSVQQFSTVVDTLVGGANSTIASSIWGVMKLSVQIASNFASFFDEMSKLLMRVGSTCPRYQDFGLLYPSSTRLQNLLCRYYTVVVNLCKEAVLFVRKSFLSQVPSFLKSFASEFGRFGSELESLAIFMREDISLASKRLQSDEADKNSQFRNLATKYFSDRQYLEHKKRRREKSKSRLLDSCSTYNYQTARKQARKKGTTMWLFENDVYKVWRSDQSVSNTLWCTGILGSGKTVLCANVVDDVLLSHPTAIITYFFCRYDEAESLKARTIIGSIARQLFSGSRLDLSDDDSPPNLPFLDTNDILAMIEKLLPRNQLYFILIDGVDECDEEEGALLIQGLQRILSLNSSLRLYCSSRPDMYFRASAQFPSLCRVSIPLDNYEIGQYIDSELEQRLETNKLCLGEPSTIISIRDALLDGAQGMFLWVIFQLDTVCSQTTDANILSVLEDLPRNLPDTFNRHLGKLQQSKVSDPALYGRLFQIIAAARRPLTLEELRHAISVDLGTTAWNPKKLVNDISKTVDACGSLLTTDEEEFTVHFAHHSIKQHLLSSPVESIVGPYHVQAKEADIRLGEICVTYLCLDVLSTQVQKQPKKSQFQPINISSAAISTQFLLKSKLVSKLAVQLLKDGRPLNYDLQHQLQKIVIVTQETGGEQAYPFLPYAREQWLPHTRNFQENSVSTSRSFSLWLHLIADAFPSLSTRNPWGVADQEISSCILLHNHGALLHRMIACIYSSPYSDFTEVSTRSTRVKYLVPWLSACSERLKIEPRFLENAMQLASRNGDISLVRLLLEKRVDPSAFAPPFTTALKAASIGNRKAIAQLLLEGGADVDAISGVEPTGEIEEDNPWKATKQKLCISGTALTIAAEMGHSGLLELLLEHGADVNRYESRGLTALFVASKARHTAIVKLLLDKGANADLCMAGVESRTALSMILGAGLTRSINDELIATMLLEKISHDHLISYKGRYGSLLHLACSTNFEEIVRRMLLRGADVNAKNKDGASESPLHKAVHAEIAELLLRNGADIHATDVDGSTPLHYAVRKSSLKLVEVLVERGANVNARTREGVVPLFIGVSMGKIGMVRYLLENGADIEIRDESGCTALHALDNATTEIFLMAELLLEHGANPKMPNGNGKLPHEHLRELQPVTDLILNWHESHPRSKGLDPTT